MVPHTPSHLRTDRPFDVGRRDCKPFVTLRGNCWLCRLLCHDQRSCIHLYRLRGRLLSPVCRRDHYRIYGIQEHRDFRPHFRRISLVGQERPSPSKRPKFSRFLIVNLQLMSPPVIWLPAPDTRGGLSVFYSDVHLRPPFAKMVVQILHVRPSMSSSTPSGSSRRVVRLKDMVPDPTWVGLPFKRIR